MKEIKRYHRQKLSLKDRQNYDIMVSAIQTFKNVVVFSRIKDYAVVASAVKFDNPQFFYVNWSNGVTLGIKKHCAEGLLSFSKSESEVKRLLSGIKDIAHSFNAYAGAREKVIAVYKYMTESVEYYNSLAQGYAVYNAVGSLVNGRAICEGIASGIKLLLDNLGIDSMILTGRIRGGDNNHAWNVVMLGDKLFHLDATQDLKGDKKLPRFDYCLLSDKEIRQTHDFRGKFNPSSNNYDSYFERENRVFRDLSTLTAKLYALNNSVRHYSFRIDDTSISENDVFKAVQDAIRRNYTGRNIRYNLFKGHLGGYYISWEVC